MVLRSSVATAPVAPRRPTRIAKHDDVRVDDYFWLRERENPEVIEYLQAENDYAAAVMAHTAGLQETLFQEMRGRIKETDMTAPVEDGCYWYYQRTEEGKNYSIYCRRQASMDTTEEILLDVNELARGHEFCRIGEFAISPDHRLLAYALDVEGNETFVIYVKDLATGELLPDRIPDVYYGLEWGNDNRTLFYTTLDAAHRPHKLWRHTLGTDRAADVMVFHEADAKYYLVVSKTRSQRYILLELWSSMTSEVHVIPADTPATPPQVIEPRRHGHLYDVDHRGEFFFIRSNDQALNFRVMVARLETPGMANWRELVAERPATLIDGIDLFANHLVLYEWEQGLQQMRILKLAPGDAAVAASHRVQFPEETYACEPERNPVFATNRLRIKYSSLKTPPTVFAYDMDTGTFDELKQDEIAGHEPNTYETRRLWATAPDGTAVPISLVHRKGIELDGHHPCLLTGYGSYGSSNEPDFRAHRLSLMQRGFVFAIAHVRGGSEMGRAWYEDGKLLKKKNTFSDFVACAEKLIADGYTEPARLTIMGRSAGGLLMGAVTNLRPDLFAGVVAGVPFVDVINSMLDPSIPLTVGEYEEWGNPADPEYYAYMRSYSPYDNLKANAYPHILTTAGLNDPRVQYWEPAKYIAKLRTLKLDGNVVMMKTNMAAGHSGASGRYDYLRELAFEYAFLLQTVGIDT